MANVTVQRFTDGQLEATLESEFNTAKDAMEFAFEQDMELIEENVWNHRGFWLLPHSAEFIYRHWNEDKRVVMLVEF